MLYKKMGSNWVIRIDKGEEVMAQLKEICEKNNIKAGFVSANRSRWKYRKKIS